MAVSVTLRQEKSVLSGTPTIYRVVSRITEANPVGMYPLFKVTIGIADTDERYNGVVTLEDFTEYVENPLNQLRAASAGEFSAIGTTPGDTVEITNALTAAPEWFDSFVEPTQFTVDGVSDDGRSLWVGGDLQFPTAVADLNWTVKAPGGSVRGSGTGAITLREDFSVTTFLRRHWTSLLDDVGTAESRFAAIKAYVESVVEAAKTHGVTFVGVDTQVYE